MANTMLLEVTALLHAVGAAHLSILQRLDNIFDDSRLKATMPKTWEGRIGIVDIDEENL